MTTQTEKEVAQMIIDHLNKRFEMHYGYQLNSNNEAIIGACVNAFINMARETKELDTDCFTREALQSTINLLFAGFSRMTNGTCTVEEAALKHVKQATAPDPKLL